MKLSKMNFSVNVMLAVVFFFFANDIFAQDKIYKKNQTTPIEAKVIEIGTSEIKYQLSDSQPDGVVYVLEKSSIRKIKFGNGQSETFGIDRIDLRDLYEGQNNRMMKIGLISPLIGTTKISYEQSLQPGRNLEVKATLVGIGFGNIDGKGIYGSVGYKMFKKPNYITSDMKRGHLMQGVYVKPEVFIGQYTGGTWMDGSNQNLGGMGAILNLGVQWVFSNALCVDLGVGAGYGEGESYQGYVISGNLAMGGNINIGFLF